MEKDEEDSLSFILCIQNENGRKYTFTNCDLATSYNDLCPILTQMIPLIKRSTDNLVAIIGEKAAAEVTFESME